MQNIAINRGSPFYASDDEYDYTIKCKRAHKVTDFASSINGRDVITIVFAR